MNTDMDNLVKGYEKSTSLYVVVIFDIQFTKISDDILESFGKGQEEENIINDILDKITNNLKPKTKNSKKSKKSKKSNINEVPDTNDDTDGTDDTDDTEFTNEINDGTDGTDGTDDTEFTNETNDTFKFDEFDKSSESSYRCESYESNKLKHL
jgi:hypothetical protein